MATTIPNNRTVAIVGRPNVGKSALFNRLAGMRISIVHDMPGVTRDRITAECRKVEPPFRIMDTGGIGASIDDGFDVQVRAEAEIAVEAAEVILFVVDAREGITAIDQVLADFLRKSGKKVLLAVNKVDTDRQAGASGDFTSFGFEQTVEVSAEHGKGVGDLARLLDEALPEAAEPKEDNEDGEEADPPLPVLKIAIVGRPNVGKSSLVNAIIEDERTIVSDVAGTTRDSVDIPYERRGQPYLLIDTAGIRRRRGRADSVEAFSIDRAESAIRRADLCALVIDAANGITSQDRKIGRLILKERKPCIIVLNKFDLYHPDGPFSARWELLSQEAAQELFFLEYAPFVAVSAKEGNYLKKMFQAIERVHHAAQNELGTGMLNRILREALLKNPPPAKSGRRFNLLYAVWKKRRGDHVDSIPVPHFILFANRANLISDSYERYLENQLRDQLPLEGLPISFEIRSRGK